MALLPLLALLVSGFYALDFGAHWDEEALWIEPLAESFETGSALPDRYNYPSFCYQLAHLATAPDLVAAKLHGLDAGQHVAAVIRRPGFALRLRGVFLLMSSLSVLWVYAMVRRCGGRWPEALVAAGLVATSWEISYHTRWVAPDGVMMQFGALATLCCLGAAVSKERGVRWLVAGAVAAGFGCGAKYPGGLLLAPLAVAWVHVFAADLRNVRWVRPLLVLVGLGAIFAGTFVLTTPGSLVEHDRFMSGIEFEMYHYRVYGHGPYTVDAGWAHLRQSLVYLGGHMLSPYAPVAWALAALALVGVGSMGKERPGLCLMLAIFPVLYVGYMSTMVVFAVRNLLVVAPFLAVFAARGLTVTVGLTSNGVARRVLVVAAALALLGNLAHNVSAAERTLHRSVDRTVQEVADHLRSHGHVQFALSPMVRGALGASGELDGLANVREVGDPRVTHLAIFPIECRSAYDTWTVGPLDLVAFGPRGVNFVYYPTAACNRERILVMPLSTAAQVGLAL